MTVAHLDVVCTDACRSPVSASYDAAGDMLCRAPTSSTTCSGTQAGAQLSYDTEGRLSAWQNTPSSPATTDQFLYDGEVTRVEQQVTTGGATTTTVYVGSVEEVSTLGKPTSAALRALAWRGRGIRALLDGLSPGGGDSGPQVGLYSLRARARARR